MLKSGKPRRVQPAIKNKRFYTWDEFDSDAKRIAGVLWKYHKLIKNIYAVPKGGLPLGVYLSNLLGVPLILDKERINNKTLVVDDISDTGKTLKRLLEGRKYYKVATLWWDDRTSFTPDIGGRVKNTFDGPNYWVVMPWETNKSSKYDGTV